MFARFSGIACLLLPLLTTEAGAAETMLVGLDEAELIRLEQPASTIIVGNPAIADALVQRPDLLVVTGKSYGATNLIVLGADGEKLDELRLQVGSADSGLVTVQRGGARFSYSCTPTCNSALALGDQTESYQNTQAQVESRIGLSRGQSGD